MQLTNSKRKREKKMKDTRQCCPDVNFCFVFLALPHHFVSEFLSQNSV